MDDAEKWNPCRPASQPENCLKTRKLKTPAVSANRTPRCPPILPPLNLKLNRWKHPGHRNLARGKSPAAGTGSAAANAPQPQAQHEPQHQQHGRPQ